MKTILKKIIVPALLLAALAVPARAALITTSVDAGTNNVPLLSTNYYSIGGIQTNLPKVQISTANTRHLVIGVSFTCTGTNILTTRLRFSGSTDGSNWETNKAILVLTCAGTALVTTNLSIVDPLPFYSLSSWENINDATSITNTRLSYFIKPNL